MPTPDIDFEEYVINDELPEPRKTQNWIAWMKGLISQLVRLNFIFNSYRKGSTANYWDSSISYTLNQDVIYKYSVYKSLSDGNLNNIPDLESSFGVWQKVQDIFIGVEERARYTSSKICLEWVLNRYFFKELDDNGFVGFVQPDDPITPTNSSIYISYQVEQYPSFLVGLTESESHYVGSISSTGWVSEVEDFASITSYQFLVNIPSAVYTSINSDSDIADKVVREFLDKYVASGIYYDIVTY